MPNPQLIVTLPKDRTKEGTLQILNIPGAPKFRCYGKSDNAAAAAVGNATRDQTKPFGDLPTGSYEAVRTVAAAPTASNKRAYGSGPRWVLNPISGKALIAKQNGRYGLLIHGGPTGSPMPKNALRPTHGCLRVDDTTIMKLAELPTKFSVTVSEI